MARGARDDDEELTASTRLEGRGESLAEKSDRLAAEYNRDRQIRLREDRVRRIDPPEPRAKERPPARARKERPPLPSRRPPPADEDKTRKADLLPTVPPVAPLPPPARPKSGLDTLAVELEELLRDGRVGWRNLAAGDRITLGAAVGVLAGVFMPWVSDPAHTLQVGLLSGGVLHLALALAATAVVLRGPVPATGRRRRRGEVAQKRRAALWLVLLGAASTVAGAYLLLVYGFSKAPDWPVRVHFGLYWTLAAGTGLSYGGFARLKGLTF